MKKNSRKEDIQLHNNYDYLNFIKQNHMQIQNHKNMPFFKANNSKVFEDVFVMKRNLANPQTSILDKQQIFVHPQSKKRYQFTPQPQNKAIQVEDEKYLTHDTLIEIMQMKNQQIAEALMKQRQSMSDVVYFGGNFQYVKSMQKKSSHTTDKQSTDKASQKFLSEKKSIVKRIVNQPMLKFPQLVNKKITYNNGIKRTISGDQKNQQNQTKSNKDNGISNIVQMQLIENQSSPRPPSSKQRSTNEAQKNQQMITAYYKSKVAVLSLKQQPYELIPQYKHPQIIAKKYLKNHSQHHRKQSKKKLVLNFQKQRKMQMEENLETPLKNFLEATMKCKPNTHKNQDKVVKKGNFDKFPYKSSEVIREVRRISSQDQRQASSSFLKPYLEDYRIELEKKQQKQQNLPLTFSKQLSVEPRQRTPQLIKEQQNNCVQELQSPVKSPTKKSTNLIKNRSKNKPDFLLYEKEKDSTIYQSKIRSYRQFLFQMNLVHRMFDALVLKQQSISLRQQQKYTYYIGKGNNSLLIKSLMKRRFWWTSQQDPKKANFVWTQLKVNSLYQNQPRHYLQNPYDKIQSQTPQQSSGKSPRKKQKKVQLNSEKPQKNNSYKPPLPPNLKKILTNVDQQYYNEFMKNADFDKISNFQNRLKYFPLEFLQIRQTERSQIRIYNHLEFNYHIGNKKALFYNLKQYYDLLGKDVFEIIPFTFHIQRGTSDPEYVRFLRQFKKIKTTGEFSSPDSPTKNKSVRGTASKNIWIVKPGQLSNRGSGITVIEEVYELNNILKKKQKHSNGTEKTYIVQKYIQKPLLYNKRKFDLRHYMIATRMFGRMRAYWYGQGYVRTSCYEYDLQQIDNEYMHLTNDAIQKDADIYGKYQQANKISYNELQRYLDSIMPDKKVSFAEKIYPRMKQIALDAFKATYMKLDPNSYDHNFQVFGLDFMIDSNLDVWLIEVNTNPCLQINCNILNKIIPNMIEQCLRLSLDVVFPPFTHYPNSQKYLAPDSCLDRLQYELIFDSARDGKQIQQLYKNVKQVQVKDIDQEDEVYQNQGKQLDLDRQLD